MGRNITNNFQRLEPKTVSEAADFERQRRERLQQLQEHWSDNKSDYLNLVQDVFEREITLARRVLILWTGIDVVSRQSVIACPDKELIVANLAFFQNVEQYATDLLNVNWIVQKAFELAKANGLDSTDKAYEALFWAMENVFVAGTLSLMLDTEGNEKSHCTLLLAGWADSHISLQGLSGSRLRQALLQDGLGNLRERLQSEIPSALYQGVSEWRSGQEMLMGDKMLPAPGKKTAGRRPRTLLSRITRSIERTGAVPQECTLTSVIENDLRYSATQELPSTTPQNSELAHDLWDQLVKRSKLSKNEQDIAALLRQDLSVIEGSAGGKLCLKYGTQKELADTLGRSHVQIRQEVRRMLLKFDRARPQIR